MDTTTTPALEIRGLRRTYGTGDAAFEAVRGLDLTVERGTVVALLGTNGAGKTSTMELVEGLAAPTDGTVRVFGLDPIADRTEVRRRTGVVLQSSGFSGDLTVGETLEMEAATVTDPRPVAEVLRSEERRVGKECPVLCRDRKSTRLNSSHPVLSRMPSSA